MSKHIRGSGSPIFDLPPDLPWRLSLITSSGVTQYTQGDQTLLEDLVRYPARKVDWTYTSGTWPLPEDDGAGW